MCVEGKPDIAGGPMSNILQHAWKPVHAGSHVKHNWEARRRGRPCGGDQRRPCDPHNSGGLSVCAEEA